MRRQRLELPDDSPTDARRRVERYQQAISGELSARTVWQREQLESQRLIARPTAPKAR